MDGERNGQNGGDYIPAGSAPFYIRTEHSWSAEASWEFLGVVRFEFSGKDFPPAHAVTVIDLISDTRRQVGQHP